MAERTEWPLPGVRRAKLHAPELGHGHVSRPRLVRKIEQMVEAPISLVVGPAGFGKTTALGEWAKLSSSPKCWLTLDSADGNVDRFTSHLIESIQSVVPGFGQKTRLHFEHRERSAQAIGEAISEELYDTTERFVLVLDDVHEVPSPEVLDLISSIIQYPPPSLHLVLSARWDPQLPIARLRGRGLLNEIRAADLRFTEDEARALLSVELKEPLDRETVALLYERTEGWAAGLHLASIALREQEDSTLLKATIATSDDRYVMDFLLDEVLHRQAVDTQAFLLRTSITERICGSLADAICGAELPYGTSDATLETLARSNLYVEQVGDDRAWYRYHPLFRNLLRHRLSIEHTYEEILACHLRASAWYAEQGSVNEAISHALIANNPERAARLVEAFRCEAFNRDDLITIQHWLELLPDHMVRVRPLLLITRARLAYLRGQTARMPTMLREVDQLLARIKETPNEECEPAVGAERDLLLALTLEEEVNTEAVSELASRALLALPIDDHHARGLATYHVGLAIFRNEGSQSALKYLHSLLVNDIESNDVVRAEILLSEARIHWLEGNLHESIRLAEYALQIAGDHQLRYVSNRAAIMLGTSAYAHNDLLAAESHFGRITSSRSDEHFVITSTALIGQALTQEAMGKHAAANLAATSLVELILQLEVFEHLPIAEALQVRLALMRGDEAPVLRWLGSNKGSITSGTSDAVRFVQVTHLLARITHPSPFSDETVRGIFADLKAGIGAGTSRQDRVEIDALTAVVRYAEGDALNMDESVRERLANAVDAGIVRPFADLKPLIIPVLESLRTGRYDDDSWIDLLLSVCVEPSNIKAISVRKHSKQNSMWVAHMPLRESLERHVLEVLTEREAEVLACLNEHLSNQEIGERLYISPLTVKRHASNIYDKLGVNNRRQALVKAIELGFLERH